MHCEVKGTSTAPFLLLFASFNLACLVMCFSHAQALATLKAYSHWLSQFGMQSQSHNDHKEKFFTIMSTVIDSLLPLFEKDVSEIFINEIKL